MTVNVSTSALQAKVGRFLAMLATHEPLAWEGDSLRRCLDYVKMFQLKALDADGLRAALTSERTAPAAPTKPKSVAVLELLGVLTPNESIFSLLGFGTSLRTFMQQLTAASVDAAIKSILITVDSPGGSVHLASEAAQLVRTVRARKPVVVAVDGLDASAAYWITSNATAIAATPSALVGSIGIITQRTSFAKQLEHDGVDVAVIAAGKYKSEGHPATSISGSEREWLQTQVDAAYADFVNAVAVGRQTTAAFVRDSYGQGRLLRADDALKAGMIDRVELTEQTIDRALSAPAQFTAMCTHRIERQRRAVTDLQAEQDRAEIADYRRKSAARRAARP